VEEEAIGPGEFSRFPSNPPDEIEYLIYDKASAAPLEQFRRAAKDGEPVMRCRQMLQKLNAQHLRHALVDWQVPGYVRLHDRHIRQTSLRETIPQHVQATARPVDGNHVLRQRGQLLRESARPASQVQQHVLPR
jgi:hypothetical protein